MEHEKASLSCSCTVLFLVPGQTTSPHSAHHEVGVMFCILGEGLCKIVVLDRKLFPYGNILLSLNTHFAKAVVSVVIASLRDATPSCLAALQGGHNYTSTG